MNTIQKVLELETQFVRFSDEFVAIDHKLEKICRIVTELNKEFRTIKYISHQKEQVKLI